MLLFLLLLFSFLSFPVLDFFDEDERFFFLVPDSLDADELSLDDDDDDDDVLLSLSLSLLLPLLLSLLLDDSRLLVDFLAGIFESALVREEDAPSLTLSFPFAPLGAGAATTGAAAALAGTTVAFFVAGGLGDRSHILTFISRPSRMRRRYSR